MKFWLSLNVPMRHHWYANADYTQEANSYHQEVLMHLSETQRSRVRDIDAALERMDQGVYGLCMRCEEDIPARRMEVRPFSRYCVDCKAEVEKFGE